MGRSAVAAEDANFCLHWGFDMEAIRQAVDEGGTRGASTISQQVVKNVFLWQGRSYVRKALEAVMTPIVELVWSKRRIVEVYLIVAEFDDGQAVFLELQEFGAGRGHRQAAHGDVVVYLTVRDFGTDAGDVVEDFRQRARRKLPDLAFADRTG